MRREHISWLVLLLGVLFLALSRAHTFLHDPVIGVQFVSFNTSTTSVEAQKDFLYGVAWLHVFGFPQARNSFQRALKHDPTFCMAFWGLAVSNWQSVWETADAAAGQAALAQLNRSCNFAALSPREQAYIAAARTLFSLQSWDAHAMPVNITAYLAAMENLVETYPSDLEAQLFLTSAYFGIILPENRGFMQRCPSCTQRVMELIESVRQQLPYHPGALHYLVHISDDPWNASGVVGLAALLDRVAPDSSHAQHMQSHLLLRVGDFHTAAAANQPYCDQGTAHVHRVWDMHNEEFLSYAHLQQGKLANARAEIILNSQLPGAFAQIQTMFMLTRYYIDTQTESDCLSPVLDFDNCSESVCGLPGDWLWYLQARVGYLSVCGFAAAQRNDAATVALVLQRIAGIGSSIASSIPLFAISCNISTMQVQAMIQLTAGNTTAALHLLSTAASLEQSINPPAYGPPMDPIRCSNELYAQVLLGLGQYQAAIDQFQLANVMYPNRSLILLGLARSFVGIGDRSLAKKYYQTLAEQLRYSDFGNAMLAEAESFLSNQTAVTSGRS